MTSDNMQILEISLTSDPAELGKVRKQVEAFTDKLGFSEWCQTQIVLAIDESLTNIIRHAYQNAPGKPIELKICATDKILKISIRDFGSQSDPRKFKSRDIRDLRPGGLGVKIMKKCMDCVQYTPAPEGGTILTMCKDLTKSEHSPVSPHENPDRKLHKHKRQNSN